MTMDLEWQYEEVGCDDSQYTLDDIVGMDPAADWLFGEDAGRISFLSDVDRDEPPILFLITLKDSAAVKSFEKLCNPKTHVKRRPHLLNDQAVSPGVPVVAFAWRKFFEETAKSRRGRLNEFRIAQKSIKLSAPLAQNSIVDKLKEVKPLDTPPSTRPEEGEWPKETVITAIIDDGLGIANTRFRDGETSSRIQYFWQMDGTPLSHWQSVRFGREYTKIGPDPTQTGGKPVYGIDDYLAQSVFNGTVDEHVFYRISGIADHAMAGRKTVLMRRSHGTHVMDLAAGQKMSDAVKKRPIIAVQLPNEVVEDSSGAKLEAHLAAAIEYIRDRARLMQKEGPDLPIVVNLSYGFTAGAHDGTSQIEKFLDQAVTDRKPKVDIVIAAGNGNLSRGFARVAPEKSSAKVDLNWHLLPDDRTPSVLQLWMPKCDGEKSDAVHSTSRVEISVSSPGGEESTELGEETGKQLILVRTRTDGKRLILARMRYARDPDSGRGLFLMQVQPTRRVLTDIFDKRKKNKALDLVAPAGLWKISIKMIHSITADNPVLAWIQRDDSITGYPQRGRQSFFSYIDFPFTSPNDDVCKTPVDPDIPYPRESLLNAIACGKNTVVIGGYEERNLTAAATTAGGPIWDCTGKPLPVDAKPDALLPSDSSFVHGGVMAAGSFSGSVINMNGTSVAAPQATRLIAEKLAICPGADARQFIRQKAQDDENTIGTWNKPQVAKLPKRRGGAGRILPPKRLLNRVINS